MELKKLTIIAFNKPKDGKFVKKYSVLVNPDSLNTAINVTYSKQQAAGTIEPQLKFNHIPSSKVSFKLIFDGTGLISSIKSADKKKSVPDQIKEFMATTVNYNGSIHRPYFLKLVWGKALLFKGFMTGVSVNYKLFKPNGTPIRAVADVTFQTSDSAEASAKKAKRKSPDITHIRNIKAGDRLPNMCDEIYDGTNYYIQIAKHNKLNHLRRLKPGTQISFPPLIN